MATTVVIKLGGAAITDKSQPDTLSPSLDLLADQIADVYQTRLRPQGTRMVLIHGAGSFGHPPAKKYHVKSGWSTTQAKEHTHDDETGGGGEGEGEPKHGPQQQEDVKFGMALTRQRVLRLHHHVLQRLQSQRLPVLSVSANDTVETHEGELTPEAGTRLVGRVARLLTEGFIPLLFGDAVFDQAWGATILSGDALMHRLAAELPGVRRCVFVTDVAGIYTRDPKRFPDAALIRELSCSTGQGVDGGDALAGVDDVTGGMGGKWRWVKRIMGDADAGAGADSSSVCEVIVCQASDCGRALRVAGEGAEAGHVCTRTWTTIVR